MTIDSHFHALSMARKGITGLPDDLIGIDVGTDPGDYEERLKVLPQHPRSRPCIVSSSDMLNPPSTKASSIRLRLTPAAAQEGAGVCIFFLTTDPFC